GFLGPWRDDGGNKPWSCASSATSMRLQSFLATAWLVGEALTTTDLSQPRADDGLPAAPDNHQLPRSSVALKRVERIR
ncbi:MAG TPA: hypothetical protein VIV12_19480, partial [Streptosporangiaceae bacterium]